MLRAIGNLQQPLLGFVERGMGKFKPVPKPDVPAEPRQLFSPTEKAKIDQVIDALDNKAKAWADTGPSVRAKILRRCITSTLEVLLLFLSCAGWNVVSCPALAFPSKLQPPRGNTINLLSTATAAGV